MEFEQSELKMSDNRRMIEDLCRDLIVNNDHIHVVEQRLRASINQGLGRYESLYKSLWTVKKCFAKESHDMIDVEYLPKCQSLYVDTT